MIYKLLLQVFGGFNRLGLLMSIDATRRNIDNYKQDYDTKVINWKNAVSVDTCECNFIMVNLLMLYARLLFLVSLSKLQLNFHSDTWCHLLVHDSSAVWQFFIYFFILAVGEESLTSHLHACIQCYSIYTLYYMNLLTL